METTIEVEVWRNSVGGYEILPVGEGAQSMGCWSTFLGTFDNEEAAGAYIEEELC